jgi:hypothetical protein
VSPRGGEEGDGSNIRSMLIGHTNNSWIKFVFSSANQNLCVMYYTVFYGNKHTLRWPAVGEGGGRAGGLVWVDGGAATGEEESRH